LKRKGERREEEGEEEGEEEEEKKVRKSQHLLNLANRHSPETLLPQI